MERILTHGELEGAPEDEEAVEACTGVFHLQIVVLVEQLDPRVLRL